jgi:hypothetical protein
MPVSVEGLPVSILRTNDCIGLRWRKSDPHTAMDVFTLLVKRLCFVGDARRCPALQENRESNGREEKMNTQRKIASYGVRTAAILLLMIAVPGFTNLWAAETQSGYEMSFVSNMAHGDLLEEGRYGLVVYLLSSKAHNPIATMINRCVARTMAGEYVRARRDCNRAVELTEQAVLTAPENERQEHYKRLVVALSNRGVLRAIREQNGSEDDFVRAIALEVYSETAARNLARLHGEDVAELAAIGQP